MKPTPTLEEIWTASEQHFKNDEAFQSDIRKQFDRMEPMVKAFENKKVVKMAFEEETKTITFYIKSITSLGVFLIGLWAIIKFLFLKS